MVQPSSLHIHETWEILLPCPIEINGNDTLPTIPEMKSIGIAFAKENFNCVPSLDLSASHFPALQRNPTHVDSEVSPTVLRGIYFQVTVYRITV